MFIEQAKDVIPIGAKPWSIVQVFGLLLVTTLKEILPIKSFLLKFEKDSVRTKIKYT